MRRSCENILPVVVFLGLLLAAVLMVVLAQGIGHTMPVTVTEAPRKDNYALGVEALKDGRYSSAKTYFWGEDRGKYLRYYAEVRIYYDRGSDKGKEEAAIYLSWIPDSYSGDFAEEINAFKNEKEMKKLIEARRKSVAEYRASIPKNPPAYGLSESYIDRTVLGKHTSELKGREGHSRTYTNYYWEENGLIIFRAKVNDLGFVVEGEDLRPLRLPRGHGRLTVSDDPYNAKDFSSPEDFYDWMEDDFIDYEEAEEYWYEHQ